MSDSPPATNPNTRLHGFLFLAVTSVGWAMNWPAIKVLLREWPPLFSRGVSGVAAAAILATIVLTRGESLRVPRGYRLTLCFAAFTNVFAWMGFGTIAMKDLNIAEAALLAYTMPIWATLFAWPLQSARPTLRDGVALALGIAGVAILFSGQSFALGPDKIVGVSAALAAAILFALGGVMAKGALPMPPIAVVAWQVGLGCLPMVIIGALFERPTYGALSIVGFADLVYMALGPMALCYLTWFAALRRLPASTAAMGTLTVPVMGVTAGALLLGDPLGWREIAAGVVTLAGVTLALQKKKPDKLSGAT